jgi:hypothetical protein
MSCNKGALMVLRERRRRKTGEREKISLVNKKV